MAVEDRPMIAEMIRILMSMYPHYRRIDDDWLLENMREFWVDVLEPLPLPAIRAACIWWVSFGPNSPSGYRYHPTPRDIFGKAHAIAHPPSTLKAVDAPPVTGDLPPPTKADDKRLREIFAEVGFTPRRMHGAGREEPEDLDVAIRRAIAELEAEGRETTVPPEVRRVIALS
jgi:hypothetical protein